MKAMQVRRIAETASHTIAQPNRFDPAHSPIQPSESTCSGSYVPALMPEVGRWLEADNATSCGLLWRLPLPAGNHSPLPRHADKLALIKPQTDAFILFHKPAFESREFGPGVHCMAFTNNGHFRSESLIREAVEQWVQPRWPGERLYACVAGQRIVATNPGYAFRLAGWRRCGATESGFIALELPPPR